MYSCYRREDAADAVSMLDAAAAVLADYPEWIIETVTDPRTGLPGRIGWPPNVAEIRKACESEMEFERRQRERESLRAEAWRESAAARQVEAERPLRKSYDELVAEYSPNWGIDKNANVSTVDKPSSEALRRANKVLFERECRAAGVDPETTKISPYLMNLLRERTPTDA